MLGKQIVAKDISVGQPLPWDVFDVNGTLLLRRGFVIDTQRSLDRLLNDGMFLEAKEAAAPAPKPPPPPAEEPSALQYLMDARRLIGSPLQDLSEIRDFPGRVLKIAQLINLACQTNADVAIGSVLLVQDGSYVMRQHINAAVIANLLARSMSQPDKHILAITAAALTMNVSMHEIQDKLHDVKGQLNDKIRALINTHPLQSGERLRKYGVTDAYWLRCVEQHHEHEDGSGYPRGLLGADTEVGAKIIGLADKYCARVSVRHYKPTQPPSTVLRDLYIERGASIDPIVAAHLLRVLGIYPPGTIVRLRNGEVAIVVKAGDNAETPLAYAMLGPSGAALAVPSPRHTERDECKIHDVLTIDKVDFPIQMSRLWGAAAKLS